MSTASRRPSSRSFVVVVATAALVAFPASSSALLHPRCSGHRRAFLELGATTAGGGSTRPSFAGLDRLKAKRLSIRHRRMPGREEFEATNDVREAPPDEDTIHGGGSIGDRLEYLYDAGEERHSDDLYHLILMPS
jgi:hypothetical protein